MQRIRIALIQTHWPGDRQAMMDTYRELVRQATASGAELVCLQEFTISPYFASSLDPAGFQWAEPLSGGPSDRFFRELAVEHGVMLAGSLFERTPDGDYYDTATLHSPEGELIGCTRKVHIPQGEGYHESHFFGGADQYPVHDGGKVRLSIPTCYDQWFPEVSRICALNGAEFVFFPTAIGSEPGEPEMDSMAAWQTVMRGQAIANQVYIAAANRTGQEGVEFYGSSFVCDPMGHVIAQASRDKSEVILADLDPVVFARWRRTFRLFSRRRPETYGRIMDPVAPGLF
jgi:N-carbamoylputrescine amidase